jgi:hypothetical protein
MHPETEHRNYKVTRVEEVEYSFGEKPPNRRSPQLAVVVPLRQVCCHLIGYVILFQSWGILLVRGLKHWRHFYAVL